MPTLPSAQFVFFKLSLFKQNIPEILGKYFRCRRRRRKSLRKWWEDTKVGLQWQRQQQSDGGGEALQHPAGSLQADIETQRETERVSESVRAIKNTLYKIHEINYFWIFFCRSPSFVQIRLWNVLSSSKYTQNTLVRNCVNGEKRTLIHRIRCSCGALCFGFWCELRAAGLACALLCRMCHSFRIKYVNFCTKKPFIIFI